MSSEKIEVAVTLPCELWEALVWRAQTEQEHETGLLVRAIEQFLHQAVSRQTLEAVRKGYVEAVRNRRSGVDHRLEIRLIAQV